MSTRRQHLYGFGPYRLDTAEQLLLRDGEPVPLTPKAFDTLIALVERSGHLVEKDELMKVVWSDAFVEESNLTNNVYALRKLLGQGENGRSYIETVPKRGYRFTAPVKELLPETLVVEKRTLTRVVTEEQTDGDDSPHQTLIGAGEAIERAPARTAQRRLWPWPLIALLSVSLSIAGFFIYPAVRSKPAVRIESIAVLPFTNESGNADFEYLSDGMTELLINRLSQLPQLKVIARNSSFQYKGKEVNPQEVSRALGVQAVLLGRVMQRNDSLVLSVELMDARDKTQVWGERYTRKATDIQALQEDIARTISEKLRLRLSGVQEQQLTKRATQNQQAYEAYLNGLYHHRKGGFENVRKGLDYFNQAVAFDPNFALAWVGIANAYRYFAAKSLLDPKEALVRSKAAAQNALELDETLPEAHGALARIKQDEWDWRGAEREYKRAIELNPNLAEVHSRYSQYLSATGQHAEALAESKHAQELDPLQFSLREPAALYFARRYDEAVEKLHQMIRLRPNFGEAHGVLAVTYNAKGMYAQAVDEYRRWISIDGETTSILCYLGHALAMFGKPSEAQDILAKLKTTKEYVSPGELAVLYIGLGDKERALETLEEGYKAHHPEMQNLKADPHFDSLRSDSRFQDLLKRVGLSA